MSIEAMVIVLHHSRAKGTAKLILLGIANHAGDGGAYPSKATLARYANVQPQQVRKHLQTLRSLGEVRVHVQEGGDRECDDYLRPNRYDVLVACPSWCDRTMHHRDTRKHYTQTALLRRQAVENAVETPGVDSDPGSNRIPTPGYPIDPQTVPRTGDTKGAASTTGHAREDTPPCTECSAPDLRTCIARQAKVPAFARHAYTPRGVR